MKNVSSFLIVELMRMGHSPQKACELAMARLLKNNPDYQDFQVAFLALSKKGEVGSFCIHPGFTYVKYQDRENSNTDSLSYI